jgi:hypothetical protein
VQAGRTEHTHLDWLAGIQHCQANVCCCEILGQLHAGSRGFQHNQPQHGDACRGTGKEEGCLGGRVLGGGVAWVQFEIQHGHDIWQCSPEQADADAVQAEEGGLREIPTVQLSSMEISCLYLHC